MLVGGIDMRDTIGIARHGDRCLDIRQRDASLSRIGKDKEN
jgi:hypothetical protein